MKTDSALPVTFHRSPRRGKEKKVPVDYAQAVFEQNVMDSNI